MYSSIIIDSIIELINNGRGGQELLFKKLKKVKTTLVSTQEQKFSKTYLKQVLLIQQK